MSHSSEQQLCLTAALLQHSARIRNKWPREDLDKGKEQEEGVEEREGERKGTGGREGKGGERR